MERNEFLSALVCICVSLSLSLLLQGIILILILERVTPRLRKTNQLVKGSRCRGGIVNTRVVVLVRSRTASESHGALAVSCKYFKQSKWPFSAATNTHLRHIDHTYAQQDIRVCGDDHLKPPMWQFPNPKALWLLRVSI